MHKIDLHTHTTASDGALSPAELVRRAQQAGIGTLAVTDHDSTAGLAEAREEAGRLGIRIVPGIEFGTYLDGSEIHMLAYLFDENHPALQARLEELREGRVGRGRLMVQKLAAIGIHIPWELVEEKAGGGSVGRPHVGQALVEAGYASSIDDAFEKYIGRGGPAYVERRAITPQECIRLVHEAGGVAVLAHPGWLDEPEALLPGLVDEGLDGMEAYYGNYDTETVERLVRLARRFGLVPTGGSDFHGYEGLSHAQLGSVSVPPESLAELEARAQLIVESLKSKV